MENSGTYRIVKPNSVILPRSGNLHREPPRPVHLRQSNYDDRFDFDTVFCDVFDSKAVDGSDVIVLSGPVLRNLRRPFSEATYCDPESHSIGAATLRDLRGTQRSKVSGLQDCATLRISLNSNFQIDAEVGANLKPLFAGRRSLLTMSKDNELTWIRDWAQFYSVTHGVDAVLLYDNGSTAYSSEDVLEALRGVAGIQVAVVVEWPFPYGPQGGNWDGLKKVKWDSNYCQSTSLEHARSRFLGDAKAVVQCDIDELMICEEGTIFDELEQSDGFFYVEGHWIESMTEGDGGATPSYQDFSWRDLRRGATTVKWVLDPRRTVDAKQWRTHRIDGLTSYMSENTIHRHFRGISNGWKFDRASSSDFDPKYHVRDELLETALERAFGDAVRPQLEDRRPLTSKTVRGRVRDLTGGLNPSPARVAFAEDSTLEVGFDTEAGDFTLRVRFHGAEVTSYVESADEAVSSVLQRIYSGPGPWELDTDSMRRRSKATVASNVVNHLQGHLGRIMEELSPAPGPDLIERASHGVRTVLRGAVHKVKAAWSWIR